MRKQHLLKTMLLLCALIVGTNGWAQTVEWDLSKKTYTTGDGYVTWSSDYVTMTNSSASGGTSATNYLGGDSNNRTSSRFYTNNTLTITPVSGYSLLSIVFTATSDNYATALKNSTWTNATATSSSSTVTVTPTDGSTAISAVIGGTCGFTKVVVTYTEADSRQDAGLAFYPVSVTLELGQGFTAPTFSNPNSLDVTFSSDNSAVATVASDGTITFVGGLGTAVISATSEATSTYKTGSATFTINVIKKTPTLIVADNFGMKTGMSIDIDDNIYMTDADGEVTVISTTPSVVSVANGKLNALTTGSADILVRVAEGETYQAKDKTFSITVTANPSVAPEGQGAGSGYSLVTDASTLADGDKIILVSSSENGPAYAMGAQNTNNRGATNITIENGNIASVPEGTQVIDLEGSTGSWYFGVGSDGYLYAASSSNNYLRSNTKEAAGDNAKATITIASSGKATITFLGDNARNLLRYNPNTSNNNPLFSCYATNTTTGDAPYIYRLNEATSFDIEVGAAGWRTLVSAKDVTLPEGLKAYKVTKSTATSVTLAEVTVIAKNTAYLLEGAAGTYTLTLATGEITPPTDNLLKVSDATTGDGIYVFAKKDNKIGFFRWTGGYIGAGRAYIEAPSAARDFLGFEDGETTGVADISRETITNNGSFYNLNGQRVAQPTKGLYIVNGHKVVIK